MTARTISCVEARQSRCGFRVSSGRQIHRHRDRGTTCSFSALHDCPANFPDVCWVELLPNGSACGSGCIFDRRSGDCGQHHQMALGTRCPGHRDFAFRMESFLSAHWRQHDRRAPLCAKEIHRHIDVFDIDQPARPNLDARIAFAICPHRSVIVHTGGEIAEVCWRQYLACRRLKIHHIEGLVRRSNYTIALLQGIEPANKFLIRDFAPRRKA